MKEVLRSPSPAGSFDMPLSPAPSQGHRQSVDNFLSRLGPGMLDTSFDLEERSGQPRRSSGRKSHEMNVSKGAREAKQVHENSNRNNSNVGKASNKLHMESSSSTSSNKKLEMMQNSKAQGGNVMSSNMKMKGTVNNMRGLKVDQEEKNNRHARAVAAASAAAAEAAAVAAQAAAEVMRLTRSGYASSTYIAASRPLSLDDLPLQDFILAYHAATLIQSAYRGHLARQALRALKGLVKLQAVVRGHLVRRQARISLRCMQALVRLQARVRARQVKAALLLLQQQQDAEEEEEAVAAQLQGRVHATPQHALIPSADASFRRAHRPLPPPSTVPDASSSSRSPAGLLLHRPHIPHHHKALDSFSHASSLIGSEDSRDWDSSALSKEEIELKALKKQHAMAMRHKALSYAETHQRTPTRSSGTPTRRASSEFYQPQQQRFSRLSFNETEPEKLHRDWSWLEGWMAAHGAPSVWESDAAALWESRDERRDRGDDEEEQYGYLYEGDEVEENEEEEQQNARTSSNSLFHDHINSDDDPAIKIIEMDRVATPTTSSLAYPLQFVSPSLSPTLHQFSLSTRKNQHLASHVNNDHHHPLAHSRLHYGAAAPHIIPPLSPPT